MLSKRWRNPEPGAGQRRFRASEESTWAANGFARCYGFASGAIGFRPVFSSYFFSGGLGSAVIQTSRKGETWPGTSSILEGGDAMHVDEEAGAAPGESDHNGTNELMHAVLLNHGCRRASRLPTTSEWTAIAVGNYGTNCVGLAGAMHPGWSKNTQGFWLSWLSLSLMDFASF